MADAHEPFKPSIRSSATGNQSRWRREQSVTEQLDEGIVVMHAAGQRMGGLPHRCQDLDVSFDRRDSPFL
jgi:hypothetical protein